MTDLLLVNTTSGLDVQALGGDVAAELGLETAVLVSLFTDARAGLGEVPEGEDVRGWWGDAPTDRWGSLGWLLETRPLTAQVAAEFRRRVRDSLSWLVTYGIAAEVEVDVRRREGGTLELEVRVRRGTARAYDAAWRATRDADYSTPSRRLRIFYG